MGIECQSSHAQHAGTAAAASVSQQTTNATASQARKNTDLASPDYSGAGYSFALADSSANPNAAAASAGGASALAAAAVNGIGSWNVVGQSGAIAIHAIMTADNHVLLMMRPDPTYPDNNLAVWPLPALASCYGRQHSFALACVLSRIRTSRVVYRRLYRHFI